MAVIASVAPAALRGARPLRLEAAAVRTALRGIAVAVSVAPIARAEGRTAIVLYLLVTGLNVSLVAAAAAHGASKQYVSKALRQAEQLRDDPDVGPVIAVLEQRLFGVEDLAPRSGEAANRLRGPRAA